MIHKVLNQTNKLNVILGLQMKMNKYCNFLKNTLIFGKKFLFICQKDRESKSEIGYKLKKDS